MASIEDMKKKFYTDDGVKALESRIKTYIKLFNEDIFPFSGKMHGFGNIMIDDKKECLARILELSSLVGFDAKLNMNKATGAATIEY